MGGLPDRHRRRGPDRRRLRPPYRRACLEGGGAGGGPEEFGWIREIQEGANGNLWVLDGRNIRLSELSRRGEFVRILPLGDLPRIPWSFIDLGDSIVVAMIRHPDGLAVLSRDGRPLHYMSYPWDEPLDRPVAVTARLSRSAAEPPAWVAAFTWGSGFMVWSGKNASAHRFVVPVPFEPPGGFERIDPETMAGWYGAVAVRVRNEEIVVLTGGRPRRRADPEGAPNYIIDVYGFDGEYRRSYRLPMDADNFTTDGRTFYVLQRRPYPSLLGLVPQADSTRQSRTR